MNTLEIILECKEEDALIAKELLEENMLKAAQYMVTTVPFKADADIMKHWQKGD